MGRDDFEMRGIDTPLWTMLDISDFSYFLCKSSNPLP